jgi:hypothetical protein
MLRTILTALRPWSHDLLPVVATAGTMDCRLDCTRFFPLAAARNTVSLNENNTKTPKKSEFSLFGSQVEHTTPKCLQRNKGREEAIKTPYQAKAWPCFLPSKCRHSIWGAIK